MFIIWVKVVEIPRQIFGSQFDAINLISDKARCFSQSERALFGYFIINVFKLLFKSLPHIVLNDFKFAVSKFEKERSCSIDCSSFLCPY